MAIIYKINILQALKEKGYNTPRLRREKLLPESVLQMIRDGHMVSYNKLEVICKLLDCQPGDLIGYAVPDETGNLVLTAPDYIEDAVEEMRTVFRDCSPKEIDSIMTVVKSLKSTMR